MATRSQVHEIDLAAKPDSVFGLLITPSAIRNWWSAHRAVVMPERGGWWVAAWGEHEDDPDYVVGGTIEALDRPHRFVLAYRHYYAKAGRLPFEAQMSVEFAIEPSARGSRLRVTQSGFPSEAVADGYYAACEQGWRATLAGIERCAT